MKRFTFLTTVLAGAFILFGIFGCGDDVSTPTQPPDPDPDPMVTIVERGSTNPWPPCTSCSVSGTAFGTSALVTGMQEPLSFSWETRRYDRRVASSSSNVFAWRARMPGEYVTSVTVRDARGREASAQKSVTVGHSWPREISWQIYTTLEPGTGGLTVDQVLKFLELLNASYSEWSHDWCGAKFVNPETGQTIWLYNRVRKVRFANGGKDLVYALLWNGDRGWWDKSASNARHWDLGHGSADRLRLHGYVLESFGRIDYPPQFPGDVIHYYQ